jgi:hypothetical protein
MVVRLLLAAAVAALATHAVAQERSVAEQYRAAFDVFQGGFDEMQDYAANYRERILTDLAGRWAFLLPGVEDQPDICERLASEVTVKSRYGFVMRRLTKDPDTFVDYSYVSRGGNTFGEYVDPDQLVRWLGVDEIADSPAGVGTLLSLLSAINGIATVYRPSPDILVIQTNYQAPKIFGRCP